MVIEWCPFGGAAIGIFAMCGLGIESLDELTSAAKFKKQTFVDLTSPDITQIFI